MTPAPTAATGLGEKLPHRAIRDVPSHLRFWPIVVVVLVLDLWSKYWAFSSLTPAETWQAVPGVLEFHRSLNDGAVFGSLTGMTRLFVVASLCAFVFVLALFSGSSPKQRSLHVALALVLAGALGNLYDRAFAQADVIAFVDGRKVIGTVIDQPDATIVKVGAWPDGTGAALYNASDIGKISRQGVVRDFIRFVPRFPAWVPKLAGRDVWPWVFNIADSALVCGVGMLLINFWFDRKKPSTTTKNAPATKGE